ncbi:MAG: dephospho-CoA kinase, partial [Clostridium sp.]
MIKIGLTGGIGSGKSTVAKILKENKFSVIDADVIARDVLSNYSEILEKVKIEFGSGF